MGAREDDAAAPAWPSGDGREERAGRQCRPGPTDTAGGERGDKQARERDADADPGIDDAAAPAALGGRHLRQEKARREHHQKRAGHADDEAPRCIPPETAWPNASGEGENRESEGGADSVSEADPRRQRRSSGGTTQIAGEIGRTEIG